MDNKVNFLIIVPTYNSYKNLEELVNSLKSQIYKNWKVIFIDAPSNENHKNWLKTCAKSDSRFSVVEERKDSRGIFPAMSYGVEFANNNEWIIFLGSDDWFSSNKSLITIKRKILFFQETTINPKLFIFGTQFLKEKTKRIIRYDSFPNINFATNIDLSKLIFFGYVPTHQSLCFSSDLIKKIMPYSLNYLLAGDLDIIFKMLDIEKFDIAFIKDKLVNIQSGGISSKLLFTRLKEVLIIYFEYYKYIFIIPFFLRYFKKFLSRFIKTQLFSNFLK